MGSDISLFLNLHCPDDIWCEIAFRMFVSHPSIFFGQVSVKVCLIFKSSCSFSYYWVLRVLCIFLYILYILCIYLYILDNRYIFNKYFLPVCGPYLIHLTLSFTEQKFYILMKSSLSVLSWMMPLMLYLKSVSI